MYKKKKNDFLVILISFLGIVLIFSSTTFCYASLGEIITGADDFIHNGVADNSYTIEGNHLQSMSDLLYNTLFIIAIVVAVIIGMIIAIQFMTASASEKAKVKETLVPYVAGCIVIFGAFGIWKLIVELLSSASS